MKEWHTDWLKSALNQPQPHQKQNQTDATAQVVSCYFTNQSVMQPIKQANQLITTEAINHHVNKEKPDIDLS